jgi:non-ribosomal peptide synthetase-like protein
MAKEYAMSPLRQTARPDDTGELSGTPSLELLTRQEQRSIRLVAQSDLRPLVPISELVLIDQHEAQGWRVRQDQRLDHLFEERCDWARSYGPAGQLAVDSDELSLTYDDLDARANRLARYLRLHGAGAGDRIALLFDSPTDSYIAMLAVLKIGAAYVPLDVTFPTDRMAYIVEDARVRTVLSTSHVANRVAQIELLTASAAELVYLDRAAPLIDEQDSRRLIDAERGILDNQLAYIIYSPSSYGRPVGVAVDHPSICNFVKVAAEVYGIRPGDRVYQGLTIAFDFSVEEIWVPWVCGATLVPKPPGASLLGPDLHRFLSQRRVTAMCCVPTLLATIEDDLPDLRFLLVSGEACPQDLIARWYLPGRRFLNVYGPAEATVTAAWTELHPDKPATIGIPLPTYSTVILDVEDPYRALPPGEIGEIGIAGIGLACGYLNREDLTEKAFIPDFLDIPANPSGRIYRTGDLGRVSTGGEIEYHGRIDPRSEMRGYRIELTEIESALQVPEITQAMVGTSDLAEFSTDRGACTDPATGTERNLAEVLAEIVGVERVPVDSNFFDDLGADSMVMARFCARVRKRADLPAVSMQDIYRNPTIRSLATALAEPAPTPVESSVPASIGMAAPASTLQYVLCGTLQLLLFLGISCLSALVVVRGYEWIITGSGLIDIYLRSVLFGGASFVGVCTLPILAKWMLIGRWKPQRIHVWSLAYVRFWIVKTLIRSNPLVRFVGSPLYVLYLRALGAKVGRGVAIFSRNVPVCTDLLTIGDGTVIRKDSFFTCYRAHAGEIQTGAVTLGKDVLVGEVTVLDIGTSLGDGAQLGHSSSLHAGQAVPDGERWHGSPARRTEVDYRAVGPAGCGTLRRFTFPVLQLLFMLVVSAPLGIGGLALLFAAVPQFAALLDSGTLDFTGWTFYRDALTVSSMLFFGAVLGGLLFLVTVPRVLSLAIKPDKVYRLYGFHYWVHLTIGRMTNRKFFTRLFGDSSYIVHYLRSLGYDLSRVEQTGSNFGTEVKHDTPYLSSVGRGTMIADGLSIINADFSSTSFRVSRVSIGQHSFLGNRIAYPSQGRTGDNCLLATKVMVPLDGEVREGVGLLGSPSFEIPRSVERDNRLDLNSVDELHRRLAAKNKHNAVTMGLYLLVRWILFFGITLLAMAGVDLYDSYGASMIALSNVGIFLFTVVYFMLVDRCVRAFQALRPLGCSIYDRSFWRHERFWKVCADGYLQVFNGTPFKNVIWRLLGVRLGRRVFDDGCFLTERTFVTIGNDCTLNAGSVIQCHSQEDGAFKSDRSMIGAGCTLGVGAFVHYGVTMGEGAVLAPDSFLMKGEEIPQRARWGGNPAREVRHEPAGVWPHSPDICGAALISGK